MQFFSDNGTIEVARSIVSDWGFFQTILSKDDPTGGAKGLHVPLIFCPSQSTQFRLRFTALLNIIESLRLCNGIIRGGSSALIRVKSALCWSPSFTFSILGAKLPPLQIQLSWPLM